MSCYAAKLQGRQKKKVGAELSPHEKRLKLHYEVKGGSTKGNQNITILAKRSHIQPWLYKYDPFDITAKLNQGREKVVLSVVETYNLCDWAGNIEKK